MILPTHFSADKCKNFPVRLGLSLKRHGRVKGLDPSLHVGKGAPFFSKGSAGKNHMSKPGRFRFQDVLNDQELQLLQGIAHPGRCGKGPNRVFPHDVERLETAPFRLCDHAEKIEPGIRGQEGMPRPLPVLSHGPFRDGPSPRKGVRHRSHVPGPCFIVFPGDPVEP